MNYDDLGPLSHSGKLVCSACFNNKDLEKYISANGHKGDCFFCGAMKVKTLFLQELMRFVIDKYSAIYGYAEDEIPIVDGEFIDEDYIVPGEDLAFDIGAKNDALHNVLVDFFGDRIFAGKNWGQLELSDKLEYKWRDFCDQVKHHNRFFFHNLGVKDAAIGADEQTLNSSFGEFLSRLCVLIDKKKLVRRQPEGYTIYRARPRSAGSHFATAKELGPPPIDKALQSNRMNVPGIPVCYGSDNRALALAEIPEKLVSVGKFVSKRELLLLDLADIPHGPSIFSDATDADLDEWRFLKMFAWEIRLAVDRDDRTKLDYIPTQILTELLRDYQFEEGKIDGIEYRSATDHPGKNVVLFANSADVADVSCTAADTKLENAELESYRSFSGSAPWLILIDSWKEELFD